MIEAVAERLVVALDEAIGVHDEEAARGQRGLSGPTVAHSPACAQRWYATVLEEADSARGGYHHRVRVSGAHVADRVLGGIDRREGQRGAPGTGDGGCV